MKWARPPLPDRRREIPPGTRRGHSINDMRGRSIIGRPCPPPCLLLRFGAFLILVPVYPCRKPADVSVAPGGLRGTARTGKSGAQANQPLAVWLPARGAEPRGERVIDPNGCLQRCPGGGTARGAGSGERSPSSVVVRVDTRAEGVSWPSCMERPPPGIGSRIPGRSLHERMGHPGARSLALAMA